MKEPLLFRALGALQWVIALAVVVSLLGVFWLALGVETSGDTGARSYRIVHVGTNAEEVLRFRECIATTGGGFASVGQLLVKCGSGDRWTASYIVTEFEELP